MFHHTEVSQGVSMKRALVIVGLLTAGVAFAADAKDDATKKDQQKFNGAWKAVSMVIDGKEAPQGRRGKDHTDRERGGVQSPSPQ